MLVPIYIKVLEKRISGLFVQKSVFDIVKTALTAHLMPKRLREQKVFFMLPVLEKRGIHKGGQKNEGGGYSHVI